MKTEWKVIFGFVGALSILGFSVLRSYSSFRQLSQGLEERQNKQDLGSRLGEIDRGLKEATILQQRILLLGKRRDFENYKDSLLKVSQQLSAIQSKPHLLPTPEGQSKLAEFSSLLQQHTSQSMEILRTREIRGIEGAIQVFLRSETQVPLRRLAQVSENLFAESTSDLGKNMADLTSASSATLRYRLLEITAVALFALLAVFLTIRDLRVQARQRQALEAAERAAIEASEAKSTFLANMSHELRTPMNAVIGVSGFLSETPLNEEQTEQLGIIQGASHGLLNLLNDILDLSKIEAKKMVLEAIPVDLKTIVRQVCDLMKFQATAKEISLIHEVAPSVPDRVLGDPTRIKQIFVNLIGNAIKFTEKGSVRVLVEHDEQVETLRFSVEDTGGGMPEESLQKLFQRFQQTDATVYRKYGGTGLGLTITQELVRHMGGQIRVESELGKGTKFTFELRLPEAPLSVESVSLQAPLSKPTSSHGVRVLLAEDDIIGQKITTRILAKRGYVSTVVGTGVAVLEALREHSFELILMDCHMPELDGYETTRRIRKGEAGQSNIPIVALTAGAMKEEAERCLSVGMDGFVTKPIDPDILYQALEKWVGVKRT